MLLFYSLVLLWDFCRLLKDTGNRERDCAISPAVIARDHIGSRAAAIALGLKTNDIQIIMTTMAVVFNLLILRWLNFLLAIVTGA